MHAVKSEAAILAGTGTDSSLAASLAAAIDPLQQQHENDHEYKAWRVSCCLPGVWYFSAKHKQPAKS
jgi:hypothetical protein